MAELRTRLPVSVGSILRTAAAMLGSNRAAVLAYLAAFVPLSAIGNWLDGATGPADGVLGVIFDNQTAGLLLMLPSILAQYFLFARMLGRRASGGGTIGLRMAGFLGLAIVSFLGVSLATMLLIFPGIFLGARWLMAPAFFVDRGTGVFAALGESWRATRGHTGKLAVVLLLAMLALVIVSALPAPALFTHAILTALADAVVSNCFAMSLVALAAATYTLIVAPGRELAETFA